MKQYLDKNVFQKTFQGSFTGFKRKVSVEEDADFDD